MKQPDLKAFGTSCPPGSSSVHEVEIGQLANGTPIGLSVRLLNGISDGPLLGLCGMVHGDEYNGFAAINGLLDSVDPQTLRGRIVAIPVANPFALLSGGRASALEYERLNLNRVFPGNTLGFQMERLAAVIFENAIAPADVWLDFHDGGRDFVARYLIVGDAPASDLEAKLDLARWFGQGIPTTVVELTEEMKRLGRSGTSTVQANQNGSLSLGIELGGGGCLRPWAVSEGIIGTRNIMVGLGMLEGDIKDAPEQIISHESTWVRPRSGGFFSQTVELGQTVESNALIGHVRDMIGGVVEDLYSPFRAVVTDVRHTATIQTGEWAIKLARVGDQVQLKEE